MRSTKRSLCATMLFLQAITLGLTTPVLVTVSSLPLGGALGLGLGLTAACLVAAGLLRRPAGYALGWAVQVASLALGLVIPLMVVLGLIFGALWAGAFFLGGRIDREKAERAVLEEQWAAEHGGDAGADPADGAADPAGGDGGGERPEAGR